MGMQIFLGATILLFAVRVITSKENTSNTLNTIALMVAIGLFIKTF